jgi:hypothetical protein
MHTSGISQRESVRQNDFIGGSIEADGASLINERNERVERLYGYGGARRCHGAGIYPESM